jgi:putative FmdB family regulatory protein
MDELELMPIYEFYCRDCHTIYSFLSKRVGVEQGPGCPKCKRKKLEKEVSRFAISKGRPEKEPGGEGDDLPDFDDAKMERVMEEMAGEMDSVSEDDPKAMARMMRKLFQASGAELGGEMEEAIRRMEAGEDPDRIEEDFGDVLESADPFSPAKPETKGLRLRRMFQPPGIDPHLYDM